MSNEQKKVKQINPFLGALSTLEVMKDYALTGQLPDRGKVFRTEDNGWIVDTCIAFDTKTWETGIYPAPPNDKHCVIVEQYENQEQAEKGHDKWVQLMREDPSRKLEDIHVWGDL